MSTVCASCGQPVTAVQPDMFGGPQLCLPCITKARMQTMLLQMPTKDDAAWARLTNWERGFLGTVRQEVALTGSLSEPQMQVLELIWQKVGTP